MDTAKEVQAGEEITVTLNIEKGGIESFSRFTQNLPYGLSAERVSSTNADFSFEEQRLRIIWLKLPPGDSLSVKYKIRIDPRLTGSFKLPGEFAYVESNQRKTIKVDPGHTVNIIPNPAIAEENRINIDDYQTLALSEKSDGFTKMEVERSEPVKSGAFEYTVELAVKKNTLSKFAKIEEYIPEGYRIVEGESREGIFSFNQGMVKILWMNLPEEPEFTISYRVVPDPGVNIEDFDVNGSFSYITGNETKTIAIVEKKYDLAEEKTTETSVDTTDAQIELIATTGAEEEPEVILPEEETKDVPEPEPEPEKSLKITPVQPVPEEKAKTLTKKKEEEKPTITDPSFMLSPEKGVYYRVQLAAGHKEVNIDKYFSRLNVTDKVKMEFHEGWRKYTTGSFPVYRDARNYRVKIWETTPIKDAFVSAYNEGNRITVQEALMVTQQKWYK